MPRCQPPEGSFAGVQTATIVQEDVVQQHHQQDVLAECQTLLQQQLPADSSLQQLLEPLLPAAETGGAGHSNSSSGGIPGAPGMSTGMPGEDVATIAADSTSLAVNVPRPASPDAMAAAVAMAAAAAATVQQPILDVQAREVPRSWRQAAAVEQPKPQQQQQLAPAPTTQQQQQQAEQQRLDFKHWARVVGVCGFAALLCYLDRTNISTAIVPMAEQYGWNKQFCSIVMSAFFAGYGATQVWGGQLSDKYGGSAVLAAGLAVWSLATVLTPLSAALGTWQLLTARVVLGMAQGIAFPAIHALLAKKVPNKVRSGAIGIIMALAHCGTAIGFGASPGLIESLGWGWTFYLFGGAALLWVPFWLQMAKEKGNQANQAVRTAAAAMLTMQRQQAERSASMVAAAQAATATMRQGSNNIVSTGGLKLTRVDDQQATPEDVQDTAAATANHPILVALEQQHHEQQQQQTAVPAAASTAQQQRDNVGFWPLMRRKEVWAIAVAQYAAGWGFYGLLAWLPQFFIEHCGLQLSQLGGFTLAPYLLQAVMGASAGLLADNLIVKRKWGVRDVRVLMQVAGMMGPAACLFAAASPLVHSPYVATGLITLGMGLSALTCSGVSASHLDIAPRHAASIFGVGNTAGTLAGLLAVPGLGWVLENTGNWSLAFGLAAAHNAVGAVLWALWVGDKPLPEDGGPEVEAAAESEQVIPQQQQQLALAFAVAAGTGNEGGMEWKLKAA